MANILFKGSEKSDSKNNTVQAYCNKDLHISVTIYNETKNSETISLDVSTAIQFSKQLRKSIAIAKKQGGYDE